MSFRFVQVAFAGHNRPAVLGDRQGATASLGAAFELLKQAGVEDGRLLTGLAEGADSLAVAAWTEAGLGPVHVVYPFLGHQPPSHGEKGASSVTRLDGAALEAGGRSAHLAQTRWLIGSADLLVVIWDGDRTRGAGGTADAVRLALEYGIVVLWIRPPEYGAIRLINPPDRDQGFGFIEVLEQLDRDPPSITSEVTAEGLRAALGRRGFEDRTEPPRAKSGPWAPFAGQVDRLLHATLWRTYATFRRLLAGESKKSNDTPIPPPADLAAEPGFAMLSEAYAAADSEANKLAAAHRSQQILLLNAAILASVVGSSPAVWPHIKLYAVLTELALAMVALAVWSGAARANRHERWSVARRVAEQLRLERAAWPLGLTSVETRDHDTLGPAAQAARSLRRKAGLAPGDFDADRVTRWGEWTVEDLIASQLRYHQADGLRNERITHRIHLAENCSFAVLVAVLVGFVVAHQTSHLMGLELAHWVGGAVIMTGAIAPAIGAASLALEATLAFGEQSRRSLFMAERLGAIRASIKTPPRLDDLQRAVRSAIRLLGAQEDRWWEAATRRRLFRGG
jgi:hypothetical protein